MTPSRDDNLHSRTPMSVVVALLLGLCLLLTRVVPVNSSLFGSEFVNDEADLSLMAVDRFFALPMTNTHWPAVTNQMMLVPIVGVDFAFSGRAKNADGFAVYAGTLYRDPARLVWMHRWLVVGLTTLASVALMLALRRHGGAIAVGAALLLQNAHLIVYGTLGLGNGPALAALIGASACLAMSGCAKRRAVVAGILLGLALASRNTSILFVPLMLGWVAQTAKSWREALALLGIGVVGCVIGSSPAWVLAAMEPIRWVKANVGNFVKIGSPAGVGVAAKTLAIAGGWAFWTVAILAAGALIVHRRQLGIAVAWLVSLGVAVLIASGSPVIEVRYFDAIILGGVVVMIAAASEFLRERAASIIGVSLLLAGLGWYDARQQFIASRAGLRPEDRAIAQSLSAPPGETVLVDRSILAAFRARATSESLRTLASGTARSVSSGEALREFVQKYKLSPEVADVFAPNLTEKEQNEIGRVKAAASAPPIGQAISVIGFGDTIAAKRYGAPSVAEAIEMLRQGKAGQAIVLATDVEAFPEAEFSREPLGQGKFVRVRRR